MAAKGRENRKMAKIIVIFCVFNTLTVINALQTISIRVIHMTDPPEEGEYHEESQPELHEEISPSAPLWTPVALRSANRSRTRRSPVPDFSRLSPAACSSKMAALKRKHAGQVALVVVLGHNTVLPCHQCKPRNEGPMNWYRLDREEMPGGAGTVWRPLEVEVDRYDDERINRVYVNRAHQLVIKDFQPNDVGSYFCMRYNRREQERLSKIAFKSSTSSGGGAAGAAAAWSGVRNNGMIEMVVHTDIEIPKKEMLVSLSGIGFPKPKPQTVYDDRNVKVFTSWESWGNCTECDNPGSRRRRGSCFVSLFNRDRKASPKHLDHTLRFYPKGAPCFSSLFKKSDLKDIAKRTPEVEVERCQIACKGVKRMFNRLNFFKDKHKEEEIKVIKKKFERLEGEDMKLFCPESHDDAAVNWFNESKLINELDIPHETDGRVTVDSQNALSFSALVLSDSSKYRCAVDGIERIEYKLTVVERPVEQKVGPHFKILLYVFLVDFVIFIGLFIVRHKQRLVQVKKKEKKKSLLPRHRKTPATHHLKVPLDDASVSSSLSSSDNESLSGKSTD